MTTESGIQRAQVGDIELAYQPSGAPGAPPLVLVMGLATQMIGWPDEFCQGLAERGLFVVRFDNRDIGLSTHLDDRGAPDIMAVGGGGPAHRPHPPARPAPRTPGPPRARRLH